MDEAGIRNHRIEFVPETDVGVPPTDPAWERFSDVVRTFTPAPSPNFGEQRGVGKADILDIFKGAEDWELTCAYDLQRWLVDGGGAAQDAAGYGMLRDTDNALPATHTVVDRETRSVGGAASGGRRIYTVALGCYIRQVQLTLDADASDPILAQVTYVPEKVRKYTIDQPSGATTLTVESSDAADDGTTLTIEDDGASTTETVNLNQAAAPTTTASFSSIDAAYLSAETVGTVTIKDGSGNILMVIYGSDTYQKIEGDLGVPILGSGSHASALGSAYEHFLGDSVERPTGTSLADVIASSNITVENELDTGPRSDSMRRSIRVGNRTVTLAASTHGDRESFTRLMDTLQLTANDIVWTASGGTVTLKSAVLTDPGDQAVEAGQAMMVPDNTFTAKGDPAVVIA